MSFLDRYVLSVCIAPCAATFPHRFHCYVENLWKTMSGKHSASCASPKERHPLRVPPECLSDSRSVVVADKLEVCLGMIADRADTRCLLADYDVSAVPALPDHLAIP